MGDQFAQLCLAAAREADEEDEDDEHLGSNLREHREAREVKTGNGKRKPGRSDADEDEEEEDEEEEEEEEEEKEEEEEFRPKGGKGKSAKNQKRGKKEKGKGKGKDKGKVTRGRVAAIQALLPDMSAAELQDAASAIVQELASRAKLNAGY